MVASTIFFGIFSLVISVYLNTVKSTHTGMSQMDYTTMAQVSEKKIMRLIEKSKFVNCITNTWIHLYIPNPTTGELMDGYLWYTGRSDDRYLQNSRLYYAGYTEYGFLWTNLADYVTAISNQPMFSQKGKTVYVNYHVGDPDDSTREAYSGPGYQGQDVRFAIAPRNLQVWFD